MTPEEEFQHLLEMAKDCLRKANVLVNRLPNSFIEEDGRWMSHAIENTHCELKDHLAERIGWSPSSFEC